MDKTNWDFKEFSIEKKRYGEFEGQYIGTISFGKDNGLNNIFSLALTQEETRKMLEIVKNKMPEILKSALLNFNEDIEKLN